MNDAPGEITRLLEEFRNGKEGSEGKLLELVYAELRRMARRYMRRERREHTLQATALVHEAYLKLVDQNERSWQNRIHFMAVAANMMRRVLVDYARSHGTAKRGGEVRKQQLEDEALLMTPEKSDEMVSLDRALDRLSAVSARQSRIVELRFFGGLSIDEVAQLLGVASKTVNRDWGVARAWLHREMSKG